MVKQLIARTLIVLFGLMFLGGFVIWLKEEWPDALAFILALLFIIGIVAAMVWAKDNSGWF